jgi:hypothetical protein
MTDRRFNEEEVAAIFQQATEAQQTTQRSLPSSEGLTLAEIQEIGRQVGVAPELVARAAASLAQTGTTSTRKLLGLTIGVGQTVQLERKLSADEWDRLVVDLRETFDRTGTVRQDGSLRQWSVGALQVAVEPTANGDRVRLRTVKESARAWIAGGTVAAVMSAIVGIMAADARRRSGLTMAAILATISAGQFALAAFQLPGWARLRRKQMKEIAERLTAGGQ